jgi:hypothetical protein
MSDDSGNFSWRETDPWSCVSRTPLQFMATLMVTS